MRWRGASRRGGDGPSVPSRGGSVLRKLATVTVPGGDVRDGGRSAPYAVESQGGRDVARSQRRAPPFPVPVHPGGTMDFEKPAEAAPTPPRPAGARHGPLLLGALLLGGIGGGVWYLAQRQQTAATPQA